MNIQFQICGLIMLILLFIFYKSHKTLQLYKERVFFHALCIMIVSLTLDILSLVVIKNRSILPNIFVNYICKSYVITLIWGSLSALIYVLTDVFYEKKHIKITRNLMITTFIETTIIYILPISIYVDGEITYTYGPSISAVYIFVVIYLLLVVSTTIIYKKKLNPRRRFAVMLWMIIWIGAAAIQFFNSGLLVVGFASSLGILILFVVIENPEANNDRRFGCFNSYALTEYYKQLVEREIKFSFLEISFAHSNVLEEKGIDLYEVMQKILNAIKQFDSIFVFKNINVGFILISSDEAQLKLAGDAIINQLKDDTILSKEVVLVLASNAENIVDVDEMVRFLSYIHKEQDILPGEIYAVDESVILNYKQQQLIENEIDTALAEDRVEVFLQPIFSTKENKFTSAEALVRIRKHDGELLSPGLFIPVAEESGQVVQLGERVFEKVCDFLKNTNAIELGLHYIEINLSVIQCESSDLANRLIEIINKYEINPNLINLEITETASISARNTLLENMKALINYGFTFSLDDFGKGESNLMYVVEMPVSIVKLDYDISKAFFSMPKAPHVVRAVVNMAHDMDLRLVAEGIETKDEYDSMCNEGIDYIQGYYYSKPIPMNEFLEFLRNHSIANEVNMVNS